MGAISRYIRAAWYFITGRINKATDALNTNPNVIKANFDNIIANKKANIAEYQEAIAGKIVQREEKVAKVKVLTTESEKLEKLKAGALILAKKIVAKYNGDKAATAADPEYIRCQTAFKDYSSTLAEKTARITELTADIERTSKEVEAHKSQIQTLMRDLENVKSEKNDTVADILGAKEEAKINNMLNGLAQDRSGEELEAMRQLRQKAKASAQVGRELGGLNINKTENDFLDVLNQQETNSEFDELMGFDPATTGTTTAPVAEPDELEKTIEAELAKAKTETAKTPEAATSN